MTHLIRAVTATAALAAVLAGPAFAQKQGGILQMPDFSSPASMSMHEESTITAGTPVMPVFNNLVMFDQHVAQNSMASIVPDLATGWTWGEDGTQLTFPLRQGVKWHDGKPFTAADVKCTWDSLMGKTQDKLRINPRKAWYRNIEEITTNGDHEVTFHLKRPQPYLIALLASGQSPVYPCHVTPAQMRQHPVGTGPFKFVEYKQNEHIRVVKNRAEAREIMKKLGYGPDKPLSVKMSTRDVPGYRDAAILAISQLREIWIDSELEPIDTANWFPRVIRKDYKIGVTVAEGGL